MKKRTKKSNIIGIRFLDLYIRGNDEARETYIVLNFRHNQLTSDTKRQSSDTKQQSSDTKRQSRNDT